MLKGFFAEKFCWWKMLKGFFAEKFWMKNSGLEILVKNRRKT
jgi:hypothetical protein